MKRAKILLVDDDRNLLRVMTYHIAEAGFEVIPAASPSEALAKLEDQSPDLVITDLRMPQMDGLELLARIRTRHADLPVIVLTAFGTIDKAVEAVKRGASDFLAKPVEKAQIQHAVSKALKMADLMKENLRLAQAVAKKFEFKGIVGSAEKFREVLVMATQLAAVDTTVLIQGESGTGKELLARAIHFNSVRRNRPFVVVNCGAIPRELMESELFGYRKGAFTGALADKKGKFEVAHTGTIFLDEIGELPSEMQVKLLRVLQQGEVDVVGDPHPRRMDVRILAATNRDLQEMMREGRFREDLFYRLSVAPLHVPPLRERREDIPLLLHHALGNLTGKLDKQVAFDEEVIEILQDYAWPGNVRELENIVERLVVFNTTGRIRSSDLPSQIRYPAAAMGRVRMQLPDEGFSFEELEKDILVAALRRHDWNQSRAARYLGITRNTLIYRMGKFNLKEGRGDEPTASDREGGN
jgi:DNA-binding NtrC family response regulator